MRRNTDWKRLPIAKRTAVLDAMGIPHQIKGGKPRQASTEPVEAEVITAVSQILSIHPKVLLAVRQNGGAFTYDTKDGRTAPVWFYRIIRPSWRKHTITDFWGILTSGKPFAFECKRPDWKRPAVLKDREARQEAFMVMIRNAGGTAGFVTDPEQVNVALAQMA